MNQNWQILDTINKFRGEDVSLYSRIREFSFSKRKMRVSKKKKKRKKGGDVEA